MKLTQQIVRNELKAIGISFSAFEGEFRINLKGGKPETAYYTNDLADALGTGKAMVEHSKRAVV